MANAPVTNSRGYTRLSGQDAAFLSFEGPGRPMHIGAVAFVSSDGWVDAGGQLDVQRLRGLLAARARRIPGLDRTLARAPLTGWPIWVPDSQLDWETQVQVAEAAESDTEIRRIAEAAMAEPLDRSRPLWKVLIIPRRSTADRFALVFLAHHSLVDGIAGIDLLALLLDRRETTHAPVLRADVPTRNSLVADELLRWAAVPGHIASSAIEAVRTPKHRARLARRGAALVRTCVRLLSPGPTTLLRGANEGTRSVTWFSVEDRPLRLARQRLGGTPNDLVLAAVATAINDLPGSRRLQFRKLRAAVPVSFRTRAERYNLGNRIGLQLLPLDPQNGNLARCVTGIRHQSALQKHRGDAEGYEVLTELTAWAGQWSQRLLHWIAGEVHSYAILITSVPGPSRTYTLGDAQVQEIFPLVPLFGSQSLSVAVVRYGGQLRIGLTSSWTKPEMVETFTENLKAAFDQITRTVAEDEPVPFSHPLPLTREI